MLLKDPATVNRGIAGDITFGVLHRLDEVIARQPAKLFIEIGINDMAKDIPDSMIVENIIAIVQRIKQASSATRLFVQSILPINNVLMTEYPEIMHKDAHIIKVNAVLKQRARQNGFVYIDLYSRFKDDKGQLTAGYTTDGVHPNEAGYRLWVEILKKGHYL
jgi:lysophospholipase L1-like esterase